MSLSRGCVLVLRSNMGVFGLGAHRFTNPPLRHLGEGAGDYLPLLPITDHVSLPSGPVPPLSNTEENRAHEPNRRLAILDLYKAIHSYGVIHRDVSLRHILRRPSPPPPFSSSSLHSASLSASAASPSRRPSTRPALMLIDFESSTYASGLERVSMSEDEMGDVRAMLEEVGG